MANNQSTEKRIRQTAKRRNRNRSAHSEMRTAIKQLRAEIAAGNADKAQELLPGTLEKIDTTAQKKIVHRNLAARTKSRLSRAVNALAS